MLEIWGSLIFEYDLHWFSNMIFIDFQNDVHWFSIKSSRTCTASQRIKSPRIALPWPHQLPHLRSSAPGDGQAGLIWDCHGTIIRLWVTPPFGGLIFGDSMEFQKDSCAIVMGSEWVSRPILRIQWIDFVGEILPRNHDFTPKILGCSCKCSPQHPWMVHTVLVWLPPFGF